MSKEDKIISIVLFMIVMSLALGFFIGRKTNKNDTAIEKTIIVDRKAVDSLSNIYAIIKKENDSLRKVNPIIIKRVTNSIVQIIKENENEKKYLLTISDSIKYRIFDSILRANRYR